MNTSGSYQNFSRPLAAPVEDPLKSARISCFLTLKDEVGPSLRLEIDSIEVNSDDNWLKLNHKPFQIESNKIGKGQAYLGGASVPPGNYQRLRFAVTKGESQNSENRYIVVSTEPFYLEVDLARGLEIEPEESVSIFITWDLQNSIGPNNTLDLDLTVRPPMKQLLTNLVYVACPDIDTIFIVRADNNWVVDSFGIKGGPTYLAIDPDSRQFLYVLTSRDRMIKAVELTSYRVVNFFSVPLNDNPTFMIINPNGKSAFLLDEKNGYLTRIDLTTGQILARVQLDGMPNYAAFLEAQNQLAVSLSLSQKVLLLDPASLRLMRTITTGSSPCGLTVFDNQLIVAEYGDNTVSVVDLANRGVQSRLSVGFGPRRLQKSDNQIYVSNYQEGSLSVLVPRQLGVVKEIYGLGLPLEMTFNQSYLRLYVTDEEKGALAVIDTNSNRLLGHIFLGARPLGLEIIQ